MWPITPTAKLVGSYVPDDLAVITIGSGHRTTAVTLADSSKVEVGDIVLAVGNPLGLQRSVTDGIVSAVGRDVGEGGLFASDSIPAVFGVTDHAYTSSSPRTPLLCSDYARCSSSSRPA